MTPAEFAALLKPGGKLDFMFTADDGIRLANALAGLDESQRRKLSKTASQFYQRARKQPNATSDQEFGALAVLAVCPLSEARKVDPIRFHRHAATAVKILVDRRPDWLLPWIDQKLAPELPLINWPFLRALVSQGACERPKSDGYVRLFAGSMGFLLRKDGSPQRSERLVAEPDLLDDVWRLFDVETHAFSTFFTNLQGSADYEDWPATLLILSRQGHLDRQRLLTSCLRAINSEFSSNALSGFIHLHERLELTAEEIDAGQAAYLELLGSRKSHVVTFALDVLAGLQKAGRLDGEAFLGGAKSVFGLKPKSQPKAALSLAARIAKRQPELVPAAVNLAVEALTHESADVQEQATDLLETWLPRLHRDHAAEIRERAGGVAATVRGRIEAVVARLEGAPSSGGPEPIAVEASTAGSRSPQLTPNPFLGEMALRAGKLPESWRQLGGVDEALAALNNGQLPAALSFDLIDVPLLTAAEPIEPIRTVDELLDSVAHAIEEIESASELERILDGISRLCDHRSANFELRAAPLLKRLTTAQPGEASRGLIFGPLALRNLIHSWLTGFWAVSPGQPDERSLSRFLAHRLNEIETRAVARQAMPLLAAPTHRVCWVEPQALVDRLATWQQAGAEAPKADLIQALLRLAPGGRAAALQAAASLTGNPGRAVRWALGSGEGPTAADRGELSLWLAAGRARSPVGELVELLPLVSGKFTDTLLPPTYSCQTGQASTGYLYRPAGAVELLVECYPQFAPGPALQMRPTLALCEHTHFGHHASVSAWGFQWLAAVWPLNLDPFYADGIRMLLGRVNAPASSFEPNYAFLQPLQEPDRPWTEMAFLMAWIALVSKDADSREAAIDSFISAIGDGRLDQQRGSRVLARLIPSGWVKLNRLADAMREISRVSPLHAWWTAELLQSFLVATDQWPADVHHVLALLLELLTDLQLALSPTAREKLSGTKATGKAAQANKRLVALPASPLSQNARTALQLALETRIARAERWASGGASR